MKLVHKRICRIVWALFLSLLILTTQIHIAVQTCQASDNPVFLNDRTADIIGSAPLLVPGYLNVSGLSGKGQIIGIADSGLDKGSISDIHLDLQSDPGTMPRVAMLKSYSDRTIADDPNGHGTHMAATIVGNGKASDGQYRGVAPGASLYFQALLDNNDQLRIPDKIDDLFGPAYAAGARIHVNGWGNSGNAYTASSAQIDSFVNLHPDFLPVFGAGNSGPGAATLTSEANSKNALTIGSSQVPRPAFSPEARYADQIASSSSRGPAQDGRIKPELLAPGSAVVSACSSLTDSNFLANSEYTLMGGSSMAAAVTGGSLALLREYLNMHGGSKNPSSALLKALLVNGAKNMTGTAIKQQGFGILDIAGTILALQEKQFHFVDEQSGIRSEESREYKFNLDNESLEFKATLAWVDPATVGAANPTLVNNLDLMVKDPQGKIYFGNDFQKNGNSDLINNIEQVTIPQAIPGEYTVFVKGTDLDSRFPSQTYALVYGQPLQHDIVKNVEKGGQINLVSGDKIDYASLKIGNVVSGQALAKFEQVQAGTDIYMSEKSAYLYVRSWEAGGIQILTEQGAKIVLEINNQAREGGFMLDPQSLYTGQDSVWLNEQPLAGIDEIPTGAKINAALNPSRQTIWQIKAGYDEVQGFIENIDPEKKEIKLLQDNKTYRLAREAAISYSDQLLDCDQLNLPYGSAETASLDKLAPGMKVSLVLAPANKEVQYIRVSRDIVIGEVKAVDSSGEQLTLDTGKSYKIFPGAQIFKDGQKVNNSAIKPGVKLAALLLPGTTNIIQLQALSNVVYGRVVYFNAKNMTLYVFDHDNQFKTYELNREAEVYKKGLQVDASSIESGRWVRLISDPLGKEVWRVDIAEAIPQSSKILSAVDLQQKTLTMQDDSSYSYSEFTLFSKGGYKISPDLLLPGDKLITNSLDSPYPSAPFLAQVEAVINPGIKNPELKADAYSLNDVLIIKGNSNADRIVLFRADGSQTDIANSDDGSFSVIYKLQDQESKLRILATDSLGGGITGLDLNIRDFPVQQGEEQFIDISGHSAQEHIINLARRGIINGYGDGTFRPEQFLTRAEFICILARVKEWEIEAIAGEPRYFRDNSQIPWWATGAIYAARKLGVINGYPDGSFRPGQYVSRGEVAHILDISIDGNKSEPLTRGEAAEIIDTIE